MKPGYKTSEFWIAVIGILSVISGAADAAAKSVPVSSPLYKWFAGAGTILATAYIAGRSLVKAFGPQDSTVNIVTASPEASPLIG